MLHDVPLPSPISTYTKGGSHAQMCSLISVDNQGQAIHLHHAHAFG